ncbi:MAG: hypothetical protein HC884_16220 [Chloroflexaceae bacterium]|nr:hypothetical protein [Chloroflexaceae bacterium]
MKRFLMTMVFLTALIAGLASPVLAQGQEHPRCFDETGYCVSGAILDYWEQHGGLPVFGYPITEQKIINLYDEGTRTYQDLPVQWFQRDRLEDHSTEGQGVLAGRLGAELLRLQSRPWETLPHGQRDPPGCIFFEETQHRLCEPFLSFWRNNGSLERFGYPLTEPMEATIGTWTGQVQYFERRRMEHHLEHAGTPYEVQLGLLGQEVNYSNPQFGCFLPPPPLQVMASVYRDEVGCAKPFPLERPYAVQPFERGEMLFIDGIGSRLQDVIFVRSYDQEHDTTIADEYQGDWLRDGPETLEASPPPGLWEPGSPFRRLWSDNTDVRDQLGWATGPEQMGDIWIQDFAGGAQMLYPLGSDSVYLRCCLPRQMIEIPYLDELP